MAIDDPWDEEWGSSYLPPGKHVMTVESVKLNGNKLDVMMSSDKQDWMTPDNLLERVRRLGPIELDPCTTEENPVGATRFFYPPKHDGLQESWAADGTVFVNPPYGRALKAWCNKMREEGARKNVPVLSLTPARPDTNWWQGAIITARRIVCIKGRLKFKGAPDPAPFPSAVAYWGNQIEAFEDAFLDFGWLIRLR